ncbi:MAG TPA: peptidyl-prolyl cis-trans isomerase [Pyrinomonadaceae bacterium]|nr:peptidyl-prolyl cis-trans isomerase [Pyrinomonadaceae bacterium]
MLKFFNRLEKTRNFVLLLFGILMVLSLVLFYAPTRNNFNENIAASRETAASVSGEKVTVGELYRQKENFSSQFGGRQSFPAKLILNQLIGSRIARVEAARLGLTASDAEVALAIRDQWKSSDTPFDQKTYEENVTRQYGSVAAYEESVRDDLSARKLEAFITSGITVSEDEVLNDFKKKNTKFDLTYVTVNPTDLAQTIKPTDDELKDYFEKNKAAYYISVPQKKIKYIFINTAKIGEKLPISDADLKAEYDKLPPDKKIAGVLGQEIVVRIAKANDPQSEQQAQAKATDIEARLKKNGNTVSEEDFANVAKGYSENTATAPLGGKLPGPVRENPNKPDDPYQRLLKMAPGEITEPISYQGRYFILRRGDDVPKSFEDAKKELEVSLRNRRAYSAAAELAGKIADELKQNKDVQKTASDFAAQANMSVADMIRETPYVKPGDNIDKIGVSQQFEDGIKDLENAQDVGDKTPVPEGFAVPMLVDQKPPRDAEFDEVKAQITETVKLEKARAQVQDIANQIASGSANADALNALAAAKGLKAQDQKSFILGTPLGQGPSATTNDTLEDAVFGMKTGDVTKTPIQLGDNWVVVGVKNRQEASMDDFAKQRDDLTEQMLQQKRNSVFTDYLSATKQKMETDGKIILYPDAIAKVDSPELPPNEEQ